MTRGCEFLCEATSRADDDRGGEAGVAQCLARALPTAEMTLILYQ